ncbi:MAG: lipoyl(octanoyl) transferase LipB [Bacteroidales bacterium]|nr:lipoyl(octanoyl) transferase LipB [Bacteroidales bacterium]
MIKYVDWNLISYADAWKQQQEVFDAMIAAKMDKQPTADMQQIVYCEHPHVYTLGKHGKPSNMLVNEEFLKKINASFYPIDRGGDITYHGPGQIVGYPLLDLENFNLSLKDYIYNIEECIIRTLAHYNIEGDRLAGATGVWLEKDSPRARKICAIGVRASRYVTMHGFAFNVNTDLKYFSYINPCGFVDKGVTSLQQELGHEVPLSEVKDLLTKNFDSLLR